jgi:hypothetical protein
MANSLAKDPELVTIKAAVAMRGNINPLIKGAPQFSLTYPLTLTGISFAKPLLMFRSYHNLLFYVCTRKI